MLSLRRSVLLCSSLVVACGGGATLDHTAATVTAVRGTFLLDGEPGGPLARVPSLGAIAVASDGLCDLSLDSGPRVLLDEGTQLTVEAADEASLTSGRAYVEVGAQEVLTLTVPGGTLSLSDASLSVRTEGGSARAYVVRGEASYLAGESRGVVRAGEELTLGAGAPATAPQTLWDDWTGGLVSPGPASDSVAPGMGSLEARVPDEIGMSRWPLVMRRLEVSVRIEGDLAITEVSQEFFNPASDTVEGLYRVRVPEGAVLQRFAVDRNGVLVDGYVREERAARAAYEARVYRGSTEDPALLTWDAPGRYRARIYPIAPGESRRIAIRYAEWLAPAHEGGPLLYRYPMASTGRAPVVGELSFSADISRAGASRVRAGLDATVENGRVELRRSDFRPRADLFLELFVDDATVHGYRAAHSPPTRAPDSRMIVGEADERDFFYLPLRLPERLFGTEASGPLDVVVVADVSAGTDPGRLELGRATVESIARHLGPDDRLSVVGADLSLRPLLGDASADAASRMALGPADPARIEDALDALARMPVGGATDLGQSLSEAAALLDPSRDGVVVYVGDGAPTVGEMEAEALREHLAELPHPLRLYAVAVGAEANLDLLSELVRGGGLAMRVEEHEGAAEAALRIFSHAGRPVLNDVMFDLGTGVENVFPRTAVSVARGETLDVVGRIREGTPAQIVVSGTLRGAPFTETIPLTTIASSDGVDLRLRWASERLRQQLRDGASREEIAELGTRYGLITPYTSYYVPSHTELSSLPFSSRRSLSHHALLSEPSASDRAAASAAAVVLGPLGILGCSLRSPPGEPASASGSLAPVVPTPTATAPTSSPATWDNRRENSEVPAEEVAEPEMAAMPPATTAPTMPAAPEPSPAAGPSYDRHAGDEERSRGVEDLLAGALGSGDPPPPPVALGGVGTGRGGGGYGGGSASAGATGGRWADSGEISPPRARGRRRATTALDGLDDDEGDREGSADSFGANVTVTTTVTIGRPDDHVRSRCSEASRAPLDDRRALWRERLAQSDSVSAWVETFRQAIRDCEAHTPRERRALLSEMIERAGSIARMLELYSYLSDGGARSTLRSAILRRVRTPDDLRLVRARFGTSRFGDAALVEQVLARATTPAARLRALRELISQDPSSIELRLTLLTELERQGRTADAARLAEDLRTDPMADAGVRTAIGEMFLRMGREDEARRAFSEIVEFAPLDELARRRLGDLYRAHGWFDDAYRQYETLAVIRPDDPTVLLLLASAAAGAGRTDEALRLEQRLMATSAPSSGGSARDGLARVAQLWSSVRFAGLRNDAREAGDDVRLSALTQRMRHTGVLGGSPPLRASLTWNHPDARVALLAARPGGPLGRPDELYAEFGIEVFQDDQVRPGAYRFEVRRSEEDTLGEVEAQLVLVWNEGRSDETVRILPLRFGPDRSSYAWTVTGTTVTEVPGGAR